MKKFALLVLFAVMAIVAGIWWITNRGSGDLDAFAQCLTDKGAIFYGAFWCPHCQNQKAMFGNSASLLPYQECSSPDGKNQLPVCDEKGVDGYPTWIFADGTKREGELSLKELSALSGCSLSSQ